MQQAESTPSIDSREALVFGIYDRLYDHGHATVDVVLVPATADGEPDWERADPANVEALPADEWPTDPAVARRVCLIVSSIDGCDPDSAFLIRIADGVEDIIQIHGPAADRPIAEHIIARDIGKEPPATEPTKFQTSIAEFAAKVVRPKADNQNDQKVGKFIVTRFRDLGETKSKKQVVKGVRAAGEASYTAAKPGAGKSVIETDIAYHVAAGRDWHGRKVVQGLAVYFAAERKPLTDRRVMALRKHYGDDDIPLVVIGGKPNLTDDKCRDVLEMAKIVAMLEKEYELPCRHITIDTLARTFGGKNQNAAEDMLKFVRSIDILMEAFPDAHVNVIHHEGHDTGRAKGAIDLDGAVDASFRVVKSGEAYRLICDGANDGFEGDVLSFRMESIQLGTDDEGEPVTAPIVVRTTSAAAFIANTLSVQEKAETDALEILNELSEGGHPVRSGLWKEAYLKLFPDEKPNTVESRWKRAVKALEGSCRVEFSGTPKAYLPAGVQVGGACT